MSDDTDYTSSDLIQKLLAVQAEMANMPKTAKAFKYKYVPFDELINFVRPILVKHGLFLTQSQEMHEIKLLDRETLTVDVETKQPVNEKHDMITGIVRMTTRLYDGNGHYLTCMAEAPYCDMPGLTSYQSIGCAMTYLRRYTLSSMLGIAAEDDDDANTQMAQNRFSAKKF